MIHVIPFAKIGHKHKIEAWNVKKYGISWLTLMPHIEHIISWKVTIKIVIYIIYVSTLHYLAFKRFCACSKLLFVIICFEDVKQYWPNSCELVPQPHYMGPKHRTIFCIYYWMLFFFFLSFFCFHYVEISFFFFFPFFWVSSIFV